jgi:hypothetical protein
VTALPRFIMAAQNVQIWLSGTSSGFCPRSDQIGGSGARRLAMLGADPMGV